MNHRPSLAQRIVTPLGAAGYLTWATVAFGLWRDAGQWPPVGPLTARTVVGALLGLFLTGFVVRMARSGQPRAEALSIASLFVMVTAALGLLVFGPQSTTPVLLIVVATVIMAAYPQRIACLLLALVNIAFLMLLFRYWAAENPWFLFCIYAGFQLFAAVTTGALKRAESTAAQLRLTNAELLATRSLLAESARDGERLRVSRELHDVAGHKLTALALNLDVLRHDSPTAESRELKVVRQLTAELLADVRSVVSRLRHDDGLDLREALQRLAEVFPAPRVHVQLADDARVADADQATATLRIVQEALTNAARHAGAANVWVSLQALGEHVELSIEDDGHFAGGYTAGHGLMGMRERAAELGGSVEVSRGSRGGFRITARLPQRVAT